MNVIHHKADCESVLTVPVIDHANCLTGDQTLNATYVSLLSNQDSTTAFCLTFCAWTGTELSR